MKFCYQCKNCVVGAFGIEQARCAKSERDVNTWFVTGDGPKSELLFCSTARIGTSSETNCGRDAAWFQPKLAAA